MFCFPTYSAAMSVLSRRDCGLTRMLSFVLSDDGDEERQGQGYTKSLEHLEAYSSTAAKAMEGLVAKLRTFKYIPSSSRQSALRNPLGNKMRNAFPR